jgi:hypothetical protein
MDKKRNSAMDGGTDTNPSRDILMTKENASKARASNHQRFNSTFTAFAGITGSVGNSKASNRPRNYNNDAINSNRTSIDHAKGLQSHDYFGYVGNRNRAGFH